MRLRILALALLLTFPSFGQKSFKVEQMRYKRVRRAYTKELNDVKRLLQLQKISFPDFTIYLRAFKEEKDLELWAKGKSSDKYQLIKTYRICASSGNPGPKRREGDLQVPEGFYAIDRFNPVSSFYLSMGINYPNTSDKTLSDQERPGDDIYIHGGCATIGCLPVTDEEIMELYIFCVEAKNGGQNKIPVTFFPAKLTEEKLKTLIAQNQPDEKVIRLWNDLKKAYDIFDNQKLLPRIRFRDDGSHDVLVPK